MEKLCTFYSNFNCESFLFLYGQKCSEQPNKRGREFGARVYSDIESGAESEVRSAYVWASALHQIWSSTNIARRKREVPQAM